MEKQTIERNIEYENQTRKELESAHISAQNLLNEWLSLDVGLLKVTLWQLATNPNQIFKDAVKVQSTELVTLGKYAIAPGVILDLITVPVPEKLYQATRKAKSEPMFARPELWSISPDGKTVILDKAKSEQLIHLQDITVENELQATVLKHCLQYMESSNYLHDTLPTIPGIMMSFGSPFDIVARSSLMINKYQLNRTQLGLLLKGIKA